MMDQKKFKLELQQKENEKDKKIIDLEKIIMNM